MEQTINSKNGFDKSSFPIKKDQVKPGNRVELISTDDPYTNLKQGSQGVVRHIDGTGTLHINWDNGATLGLIPGVDQYKVVTNNPNDGAIISEVSNNEYRPFPKEKDDQIGERNAKLYQQSEEMVDEGSEEEHPVDRESEEYDFYKGKERRFRISFYVDVHVPMSENLEHDRTVAEQEGSEILKKLNLKSVSNAYMGGVAHNPFGTLADDKEFSRL